MGNLNLNANEEKRLLDFFESSKEDNTNYYVYALCDNGIPFYVGKGIGTRCLAHEQSLDELVKDYKEESSFQTEEEFDNLKDKLRKEITMKLKKIEDARSKDSFDIIIIKYGLTEHEAFMVESSVINAMKFCGIELTNIVNGHTSFKERETGAPTKARFIAEMLKDCCPRIVNLNTISEHLTKNGSFNCENDDIAFINYNKYYPYCKTNIDTWDAVRGCWRSDEKKARRVKYIFAMHNNIIKGIFKVKKDSEKYADFQKIHSARKPLIAIEKSNINNSFPNNKGDKLGKEADVLVVEEVIKLLADKPSLIGNPNEISRIIGIEKDMCYRGFYACAIEELNNDDDLIQLRGEFENCCIDKEVLEMPQGSVKFLYASNILKK